MHDRNVNGFEIHFWGHHCDGQLSSVGKALLLYRTTALGAQNGRFSVSSIYTNKQFPGTLRLVLALIRNAYLALQG